MTHLVSLNEDNTWDKLYRTMPASLRDIYYSPEYYRVYQNNSQAIAECFVFTERDSTFLYPFLKTRVNAEYLPGEEKYYDIEGAYGYNGPIVNNTDPVFLERASAEFLNWCKEQRVIAEFTRFNPVIDNENWLAHMKPIAVNQNIILDLSIEDIRAQAYEHSARKNVNKAIRNGLNCFYYNGSDIPQELMKNFLTIYYNTMDRNGAGESYYFSEKYFRDITGLGKHVLFFFVSLQEKIVSCELVTVGDEIGYSFLGGTLADYFPLRANDILKDYIISTLKSEGFKYFCLGGGIAQNDGIFNYKKCFAKNGVKDFYIGKKIHNKQIYDQVVDNWAKKYPDKDERFKHHLLKYKN